MSPLKRPHTLSSRATVLLWAGALLLLVVAACAPPSGDGADGGAAEDSRAILMPVPGDPTVSFNIWIQAGSMHDPPGKEGVAALTGSMISQGATTKNAFPVILEKLYPLAASYSVRVDKEMTTLTGRAHVETLDTFVELLTDALLSPAFDASDFERLKSNQLNGLKTRLRFADDETLGKAALRDFIFAGTAAAHPIGGTVKGVEGLTLDDVKSFYNTYYNRDNVVVALGGGYPESLPEQMLAAIDGLPEGATAEIPTAEIEPLSGRTAQLVQKSGADASISFGFPIDLKRGDRDFYALWVANSWLGEHRNTSSHLFQVIRELRGMNYGDYSYIEAFPEGGRRQMPPTNVARRHQLFEVWIRTLPNEQALFALRAALREVDRLVKDGMSAEDFELTRSFMTKYHLHYAPSTSARLGYKVDDAFYGIEGDGHLANFASILPTLTLEEVNAAIQKHWQLDNLKIAIVTGDAEGLKAGLESDAPTPMTYATPKPDEILEEDKEISTFPLGIAEGGVTVVPVEEIFGQ